MTVNGTQICIHLFIWDKNIKINICFVFNSINLIQRYKLMQNLLISVTYHTEKKENKTFETLGRVITFETKLTDGCFLNIS